jgi:transcriptional regulator with XRE-family HTH domain
MKASSKKLGLAIQLFLLQQRISLDMLAEEMNMNPDSLSNLIHGRRNFRDKTLDKLANTSFFKAGRFTFKRLKSLRALDDYPFDELVMGVLEGVRQGEIDKLPTNFFQTIEAEFQREGLPVALQEKQRVLLELVR